MMANEERVARFGAALVKVRQRERLSQETLAAKVGSTQSTISSWERGESEPPPDLVFEIERALKVEPGSLSKLLGYIPVGAAMPYTLELAILSEPTLEPYKRTWLCALYERMLED